MGICFHIKISFQRVGPRKDLEKIDCSTSRHPEFRYQTEFQSHEPEVCLINSGIMSDAFLALVMCIVKTQF